MKFGYDTETGHELNPGFCLGHLLVHAVDVIVSEEKLMKTAMQSAQTLGKLDMAAHNATKLRVREKTISIINKAIEKEFSI